FGLNRSALTVLNALLSFHQGDVLADAKALVVFPSNRTLAGRAHAMPESTLRRNLGLLIKAGLITRHDSPNGKRYAVHGQGGEIARAFGFDLRPLLVRAEDIRDAAALVLRSEEDIKRAREKVMLLKRDCWKILDYARQGGLCGDWEALEAMLGTLAKQLRRQLKLSQLDALCQLLTKTLQDIDGSITAKPQNTDKLNACDSQIERRIQSSNKDKLDSETAHETQKEPKLSDIKTVPMGLVMQACPDIATYATEPIRHQHELIETAHFLHRMMGISPELWQQAMASMGQEAASVALACILQRVDSIKNPGGYLRALTQKAETGSFSVWPMVRALLGRTSMC
ncbi:MAG: plasmid replication protein RepC, partial [Cognatishimia sp.]